MSIDRQELIANQSLFYRQSFRKLLRIALILVIINFGLLGIIFYLLYIKPPVSFFATTTDGRLIEMTPAR